MNDFSVELIRQTSSNIDFVRRRMEAAARRARRNVADVRLIAVGKNFSSVAIRAAYACGLRDFGENRVQETVAKYNDLVEIRDNITLHMIGHLQTNKVRDALKLFDIIHSVDSAKLAHELNSRAERRMPVLVEVNVAGEESKYGLSSNHVKELVKSAGTMSNIEVRGLMTVAPYMANAEEVRPVFRELKKLNDSLGFKELSMGMTDDFEVAIEEGATMIRVGRAIFGERRY